MQVNNSYRWEMLSITRFFLALIVLVSHLKGFVNIGYFNWIIDLGAFEAILGFLLISGFSIGKSIKRNKENYLMRRVERIYPVYLASILITWIVYSQHLSASWVIMLFINLIFLNQAFTNKSFVGPAWSLALEVWLYLLAPLLLKASFKLLMYLIVISFVSFCFYTMGRTIYNWPFFARTQYGINLLCLSFIWIAGFALATHADKFRLVANTVLLIFVLHILFDVAIQFLYRWKHHHNNDFFMVDLLPFILKSLCLTIVCYAVIFNKRIPAPGLKLKAFFNFLGNISYPLYLIHSPVFVELKKFNVKSAPVFIAGALIASCIIYYVFDFYSKRRTYKMETAS